MEDDERAGTVLAVSDKYVYNSIFRLPLPPCSFFLLDITLYLPHVLCSNMHIPRWTHVSPQHLSVSNTFPWMVPWWLIQTQLVILSLLPTWLKKSLPILYLGYFFPLTMSADAYSSVFRRVLNHTYTPMATRLLRVNILSPITGELLSPTHQILSDKSCLVHSSIDARLDVVEGKRKWEND